MLNERARHSFTGPPTADNVLVNGTMKNDNGGGQRYDVIVNASQTADNYWFCIGVGMDCGYNAILSSNIQVGAIFHYDGASDAEPTTAGATLKTSYVDETTLTPWSPTPSHRPLSRAPLRKLLLTSTSIPPRTTSSNGLSMYALGGDTAYANKSNIFEMPEAKGWIQTTSIIKLPRSIHLHGHGFYIVGRGDDVWDGTTTGLNPTHRDIATLPAGGYLTLAFPADNPGA
ncbi:hypothetical protein V2W45_1343172 [Cenococcum geophilum]